MTPLQLDLEAGLRAKAEGLDRVEFSHPDFVLIMRSPRSSAPAPGRSTSTTCARRPRCAGGGPGILEPGAPSSGRAAG